MMVGMVLGRVLDMARWDWMSRWAWPLGKAVGMESDVALGMAV